MCVYQPVDEPSQPCRKTNVGARPGNSTYLRFAPHPGTYHASIKPIPSVDPDDAPSTQVTAQPPELTADQQVGQASSVVENCLKRSSPPRSVHRLGDLAEDAVDRVGVGRDVVHDLGPSPQLPESSLDGIGIRYEIGGARCRRPAKIGQRGTNGASGPCACNVPFKGFTLFPPFMPCCCIKRTFRRQP